MKLPEIEWLLFLFGGKNEYGQLGLNDTIERDRPVKLDSNLFKSEEIVQIAAGNGFSAVLTKCGKVFTWGKSDHWRLGYETDEEFSKVPKLVTSLKKY